MSRFVSLERHRQLEDYFGSDPLTGAFLSLLQARGMLFDDDLWFMNPTLDALEEDILGLLRKYKRKTYRRLDKLQREENEP